MKAKIRWIKELEEQILLYYQNATFPTLKINHELLIDKDMKEFALGLQDGTIIATSYEMYQDYIKNTNNKDKVEVNTILYGESDHWEVELKINGKYEFVEEDEMVALETEGDSIYTLKYKRELREIEDMTRLEVIKISSSLGLDSPQLYKRDLVLRDSVEWDEIYNIDKYKELKIEVVWNGENGGADVLYLR